MCRFVSDCEWRRDSVYKKPPDDGKMGSRIWESYRILWVLRVTRPSKCILVLERGRFCCELELKSWLRWRLRSDFSRPSPTQVSLECWVEVQSTPPPCQSTVDQIQFHFASLFPLSHIYVLRLEMIQKFQGGE